MDDFVIFHIRAGKTQPRCVLDDETAAQAQPAPHALSTTGTPCGQQRWFTLPRTERVQKFLYS